MKRAGHNSAVSIIDSDPKTNPANNRQPAGERGIESADLGEILASLQTVRDGNFSVRLPATWTGLGGKLQTHLMTLLPPTSKWRRS